MTLRTKYRCGVSLHGHTSHSRESLRFFDSLATRSAMLRALLDRGRRRFRAAHGSALDLQRGWWTPPIGAHQAWSLEREQIERMDLSPLVSLSDHDTVAACLCLRAADGGADAVPVSVEWSLPYRGTELHIGIHNIPIDAAVPLTRALNEYTRHPLSSGPAELLEYVASQSQTLIILNHPLWDETRAGEKEHMNAVREFLSGCGTFTHALEWNGLRPYRENLRVAGLARAWSKPVIAGGDRHTFEANTVLNLTNASCFSEFADEVRNGHSTVILLPAYRQPLGLRLTRMVFDVLSIQPEHPRGWTRWSDRVFYVHDGAPPQSLTDLIYNDGMPFALRVVDATTGFLPWLQLPEIGRLMTTGRNPVFVG